VEDFAPNLPFPRVMSTLRRCDADGILGDALELFLIAWRPVLTRQAFTLVHARSLDPNTWADEALSVVLHEILDRLPALVRGTVPVQNLMAFIRQSLTRRWDVYLDSPGGLDGRGEMKNVHRRRVRLNRLRAAYLKRHGMEPPDAKTFLDWANLEQAKTQKDPSRTGMVFTDADLRGIDSVLSTDVEGGDLLAVSEDVESDSDPLTSVDRKRLARLVIEQSRGRDAILGEVARIVFGPQTTDCPGPIPCTDDVAVALRIRHPRAAALIEQTHAVARDILTGQFGIVPRE
jgi:hypothetical protein